jgi:hypothetical protein
VESAKEEERKRDRGGMKNERVGKWLKRKRGAMEAGGLQSSDDDN